VSLSTKIETTKVCHTLLHNPNFFLLLIPMDVDVANQMRGAVCPHCGEGVLHQANYPRKPKGCPREMLDDYRFRWSFCCSQCRRRCTPASVRFLGRRVYVALAVVLLPQRRKVLSRAAIEFCDQLDVPARTIARWRQWWLRRFPFTTLWQAQCARFMPPIQTTELPTSLIERFTDTADVAMMRLLRFLSPLSVPT